MSGGQDWAQQQYEADTAISKLGDQFVESMGEPVDGDCCPSCGTDYVDHLGLIGTCRQLQEARREICILKRQLEDLRK